MIALSLSLFISKTTIQAVAEWNRNVCSLLSCCFKDIIQTFTAVLQNSQVYTLP